MVIPELIINRGFKHSSDGFLSSYLKDFTPTKRGVRPYVGSKTWGEKAKHADFAQAKTGGTWPLHSGAVTITGIPN